MNKIIEKVEIVWITSVLICMLCRIIEYVYQWCSGIDNIQFGWHDGAFVCNIPLGMVPVIILDAICIVTSTCGLLILIGNAIYEFVNFVYNNKNKRNEDK